MVHPLSFIKGHNWVTPEETIEDDTQLTEQAPKAEDPRLKTYKASKPTVRFNEVQEANPGYRSEQPVQIEAPVELLFPTE